MSSGKKAGMKKGGSLGKGGGKAAALEKTASLGMTQRLEDSDGESALVPMDFNSGFVAEVPSPKKQLSNSFVTPPKTKRSKTLEEEMNDEVREALEEEEEDDGGNPNKTAEDIADDLAVLIAEELDIPDRDLRSKKDKLLFKTALYSRILEAESPNVQQKLYSMVWVRLVVVDGEDEDSEPVVKPLVKVLLSDSFERRDVQTEVQGQRRPSGWLARHHIIDADKATLREMLDEPGERFACMGTTSNAW